MTLNDVINFALKNGIDLNNDEANLIFSYIKNDWRTIVFGNPRGILDELKEKLEPHNYSKIETLYLFFKDRYSNL